MKDIVSSGRVSDAVFSVCFSPFTAHAIEYGGVLYPTVEHAYHAQRYADPAIREEICTARSPLMAWSVSQKYKAQQQPDFPERKVSVMKELCRAKLEQHADVRQALLESGDRAIVKHTVVGPGPDGFWDDGGDGSGKNMTGVIWMALREELLQDKAT